MVARARGLGGLMPPSVVGGGAAVTVCSQEGTRVHAQPRRATIILRCLTELGSAPNTDPHDRYTQFARIFATSAYCSVCHAAALRAKKKLFWVLSDRNGWPDNENQELPVDGGGSSSRAKSRLRGKAGMCKAILDNVLVAISKVNH